MSDKSKTLLEEALIDYDNMLKEAKEMAKESLAISMPDKFESLVEKHLNKNKINESSHKLRVGLSRQYQITSNLKLSGPYLRMAL